MNDKEKRKHMRVTLVHEVMKVNHEDVDRFRKIRDISKEGIYIEDIVFAPGTQATVTITLPGELGDLPLQFEVIRCDWARLKNKKTGVAAKFINLTEGQMKILDAYIIYVRNKQIVSVSKRIIEEFFGKLPPRV